MKVKINGFDIECTPEEFLELTRELGKAGQSADEIQKLPNDIQKLPDDFNTWIRHPDIVAMYGCQIYPQNPFEPNTITYTVETALDENLLKDFNEQKEKDMDAKKAYYEKHKALREKPKDFPPYLDSPKQSKD